MLELWVALLPKCREVRILELSPMNRFDNARVGSQV